MVVGVGLTVPAVRLGFLVLLVSSVPSVVLSLDEVVFAFRGLLLLHLLSAVSILLAVPLIALVWNLLVGIVAVQAL